MNHGNVQENVEYRMRAINANLDVHIYNDCNQLCVLLLCFADQLHPNNGLYN